MKYRIDQKNYHDFSVFERNKLPPRSYFIPYPDRERADAVGPLEKRYGSEKVLCLNGDWDFRFYPRPSELPEVLDTDAVDFDRIAVPGCWQFQGYDRPFYLNVRYQFPFDPPRIPTLEPVGSVFSWIGFDQGVKPRWKTPKDEYNFVGVYRRFLELGPEDRRYVISFLGVASCLDLYVNGQFVGYSEGAHNTAEFDLTPFLHPGQNELLAVVRRWCTGTYLECQDMFRNNGIFRDVLLRISEPTDLWDVDARTEKHGHTYTLILSAEAAEGTELRFSLKGHGLHRSGAASVENGSAQIRFEGLEVTEWNAEFPTLYDVYYETKSCCVRERIGFRTVEIRGDVFLLNGKKLKLKGVNHHDSSPTGGYTLTPAEIERDLRTCKEFNIDTIRTSHYPPDPLLLELADELGLYIVDENDLETHGTWAHRLPPSYDLISDDPKWKPRYLDRIARLYGRDKLHGNCCVILWSLGNESGGTKNTDAMYAWLKSRSDLPIHYESVIHCKRTCYDVGSEMYPKPEDVLAVGEHRRKQKQLNHRPYFLCEYAHAMGVGPGNTEAYWRIIYGHDNLMGGCVWEFADHAVLHQDGSYTYGGDHGEWEHDGNFCVDGLFYPDRTPSTGARILKHIYRPIRIRHGEGSVFELFNTTAFTPGSCFHLELNWNDGSPTQVLTPDVAPLSKKLIKLPLGKMTGEGRVLYVRTYDTRTGALVGFESLVLDEPELPCPAVRALPTGLSFPGGHFCLELPDGHRLAAETPSTSLWRAATDNDRNPQGGNTMKKWYDTKETVLSVRPIKTGMEVRSRLTRDPLTVFEVTDTYEGTAEGILVTSRLHCVRGRGTLPRFGKVFRLHRRFDRVEYRGRTGESYCDMKEQFPIGTVQARVTDLTEPNIKPQESGNRCDCTWAALSDGKTTVRFEAVDRPFELGVKPCSDLALTKMTHREDEHATGTYVTIQAFQQGIGTGSCGPRIAPEFTYPMNENYMLRFVIRITE